MQAVPATLQDRVLTLRLARTPIAEIVRRTGLPHKRVSRICRLTGVGTVHHNAVNQERIKRLVATGKSHRTVADRLGINPDTVLEVHKGRVGTFTGKWLTAQQIEHMRLMRRVGIPLAEVARQFLISEPHCSALTSGNHEKEWDYDALAASAYSSILKLIPVMNRPAPAEPVETADVASEQD